MVNFSCHCLNVQIHARGPTPPLQDVPNIELSDATAADPFFTSSALVVSLDLCGVTKSQNLLCKERLVDGWVVTTCTCCQFDICASHPEEHWRVLVNNTAETDDSINALRQSNGYSRLFQLVLPDINDNFIQNNIGIELHNRNLDSSVEHVQKLVSNYLTNEQKAMEARIKQFNAAQELSYAELLQKIRKQKQYMIYLLLKSKENEAPNQNEAAAESPLASPAAAIAKDATWIIHLGSGTHIGKCPRLGRTSQANCNQMVHTYGIAVNISDSGAGALGSNPRPVQHRHINYNFASNESSTSTDSAFDKSDASVFSYEKTPRKPNVRSLRRTMSHNCTRAANKPKKSSKGPRKPPVHIDVGGVFDMEEFDSKEEYSDEDSEGSEGSNEEDSHHGKSGDRMVCATSLPMSIPAFTRHSHYNILDDDEDDYKAPIPKNPEDIAASMRALACSVTDGTEMFGELPRRRLNTGELLASRPL